MGEGGGGKERRRENRFEVQISRFERSGNPSVKYTGMRFSRIRYGARNKKKKCFSRGIINNEHVSKIEPAANNPTAYRMNYYLGQSSPTSF